MLHTDAEITATHRKTVSAKSSSSFLRKLIASPPPARLAADSTLRDGPDPNRERARRLRPATGR